MDVFKNTKKFKKIIIVLLIMILFNFCYPKVVRAGDTLDWILVGAESLFFGIFDGIQNIVDKFFIDDLWTPSRITAFGGTLGALGKPGVVITSAENIIKGKFLLMNPNIFESVDQTNGPNKYMDYYKVADERNSLRDTISGWYYALRNLAIVALLSILVYVAIRMILTSVSQDKAKYKMMFKDWLIALCLLFLMHYIMVGILNLSSTITNAIGTNSASYTSSLRDDIEEQVDEATEETRDSGTDDDYVIECIMDAIANTVIYAAMVIMNIIFIGKYTIRALTIIFLVLLAPITAITYPIDKISDGKSQAFDMWFKEFLYQVIIQPFHLLIYIVLIGSAANLAADNLIYAMLCFGVMIPAEKFIKQMFGFKDKLGSPLGAFAAGALGNQLMSKMKSGMSGGNKGGNDSNSNKSTDLPPSTKSVDLPGGEDSENPNNTDRTNPELNGGDSSENEDGANPELNGGDTPENGDGSNPELNGGDTPENGDDSNPELNEGDTSENEDEANTESSDDDETNYGNDTGDTQTTDNNESKTEKFKAAASRVYRAANSRHGQKIMNKYGMNADMNLKAFEGFKGKDTKGKLKAINEGLGVTKSLKLAKKMTGRGLGKVYSTSKNVGRKAIKGATTLAGAAALGAFGAMFGQGKAGMAAGAALGSKVGGGITKATDKIWESGEGYVKDMHNAAWNKAEEIDKNKFKTDKSNIDLARQNYRDRHDGVEATGNELNSELENMYNMHSHGIKNDQFNDTLSQYEDYRKDGMAEDEAMDTAMLSALQAQNYSAKDFRDEKAMKQASEELYKQYKTLIDSKKISEEAAKEKIKQILKGGAKMKGVKEPPLPNNATIDIPLERTTSNLANALGIHSSNLTPERRQSISNLRIRLKDSGYTDSQIEAIARNAADSKVNADGVISNFENITNASIEYIEDGEARAQAEKLITAMGGAATKEQVDAEMQERFVIKSTFDVKDEKDISAARSLERNIFKETEKTQVQAARDFAREHRGKMDNDAYMKSAKEDLFRKLKASGKVSDDKARKDVDNIVKLADIYSK